VSEKTVTILGKAPSIEFVDFTRPGEFWALNDMHRTLDASKCQRWFQMHRPGSGEGYLDEQGHLDWLEEGVEEGQILYMIKQYPQFPSSVPYPFAEVVDNVCPNKQPYFTNSIDYMVCLAILYKYDIINFFGVDLIMDAEHTEEGEFHRMRQSLEFYIGLAMGRGAQVNMHEWSSLLRADRIYGYDEKVRGTETLIKDVDAGMDRVKEQQAEAKKGLDDALASYHTAEGYLQAMTKFKEMLKYRERGGR